MVLKFDHSEAQLNQPPEARQVAPERARPSEEDRAQERRRSIAEDLLQRERRKVSHSTTPATLRRVRWTGDAHDPKAVVLKLNGDKLKKVQAQYRRLRLTQVEGMAMEQAIGLHVPSTKGVAPYSRADLKYDMQTGMIELVPLKKGTLVEEPWTRSMSKSSRRLRNR